MLLGNVQAQFKGTYLAEITTYGQFWSKLVSCHHCQSSSFASTKAVFATSAVPMSCAMPRTSFTCVLCRQFHIVKNLIVVSYKRVFILLFKKQYTQKIIVIFGVRGSPGQGAMNGKHNKCLQGQKKSSRALSIICMLECC